MYICRKLLHLEQLQTLKLSPYCTVQPWTIEPFVTEVTQGCVLNVCLTSSWTLTEMLHTLQCQYSAQCSPTYIALCYVNDTTTHPTCWAPLWATCEWMLQTLQSHFTAHCSPTYITLPYVHDTTCPTCWVSYWRLTHKAKLSSNQLGCHASSLSGFLIFCLSMLSAVFLFFCCCQSVQKLDLSTWSLMCALCAQTISVCLLQLKFLGNLWA